MVRPVNLFIEVLGTSRLVIYTPSESLDRQNRMPDNGGIWNSINLHFLAFLLRLSHSTKIDHMTPKHKMFCSGDTASSR